MHPDENNQSAVVYVVNDSLTQLTYPSNLLKKEGLDVQAFSGAEAALAATGCCGVTSGMANRKEHRIEALTERCTGCLCCMLACSLQYTKAFNPSAAHIRVILKGKDCNISFTPECTGCGICADHCFYDALMRKPNEVKS